MTREPSGESSQSTTKSPPADSGNNGRSAGQPAPTGASAPVPISVNAPNLADVIGSLLYNIAEGQHYADHASAALAEDYKADPVLILFPIPRMVVSAVEVDLKMAIVEAARAPEVADGKTPLADGRSTSSGSATATSSVVATNVLPAGSASTESATANAMAGNTSPSNAVVTAVLRQSLAQWLTSILDDDLLKPVLATHPELASQWNQMAQPLADMLAGVILQDNVSGTPEMQAAAVAVFDGAFRAVFNRGGILSTFKDLAAALAAGFEDRAILDILAKARGAVDAMEGTPTGGTAKGPGGQTYSLPPGEQIGPPELSPNAPFRVLVTAADLQNIPPEHIVSLKLSLSPAPRKWVKDTGGHTLTVP
jgi:hypothetical protein